MMAKLNHRFCRGHEISVYKHQNDEIQNGGRAKSYSNEKSGIFQMLIAAQEGRKMQ